MAVLNRPGFIGRSIHRLDSKGRIRIPAKFRDVLQKNYTDALVLVPFGLYIAAYPPEAWRELIDSNTSKLSEFLPDHRSFLRFVGSVDECDFDNQGRVLIPPHLREEAGLGQELVLAGALTNFEIWDKGAWEVQDEKDRRERPKIMESVAAATRS